MDNNVSSFAYQILCVGICFFESSRRCRLGVIFFLFQSLFPFLQKGPPEFHPKKYGKRKIREEEDDDDKS